MAAAHPLVVAAFAVSVVNLVHVCYQGCALWDQTSNLVNAATQRPPAQVDVSCWMPADVSHTKETYDYIKRTCSSRLKKVLTGQMDLDSAGIGAPDWNQTHGATWPGPFVQAARVLSDMPPVEWEESVAEMDMSAETDTMADDMFVSDVGGNSGRPQTEAHHGQEPISSDNPPQDRPQAEWYKLHPLLCFEAALTVLGFLLAVCYTRLARSHACFLNVAWRRAASGERVVGSSGLSGRASLLERNPELVSERLQSLLDSRLMSVTYAIVTLILIIVWIIIGISMAGFIATVGSKIDAVENRASVAQPHSSAAGPVPPSAGDDSHTARGGIGRGRRDVDGSPVKGTNFTHRGVGGDDDYDEDNTVHMTTEQPGSPSSYDAGFRPNQFSGPRPRRLSLLPATYSAGDFFCYFEIAGGAPVEAHSVQCGYEVTRDPPPVSPQQLDDARVQGLLSWKLIMLQNMGGCFVVAFILVLHIGFMYISEPISTEKTVFPIMAVLGSRPKNMGLRFALTDLFFVSVFSDLQKNIVYSVNTSGARDMLLSATNSASNLLPQDAGPLPDKTVV